jgi:hypothetical protein
MTPAMFAGVTDTAWAILWTLQTHERADYAVKKYGSDNTPLQSRARQICPSD